MKCQALVSQKLKKTIRMVSPKFQRCSKVNKNQQFLEQQHISPKVNFHHLESSDEDPLSSEPALSGLCNPNKQGSCLFVDCNLCL